ncbi:MAG: deoxyguanosinetriphosphate triphosphohydrolase, partial [Candidatus Limnocylindria bacterium]
QQHAIALLHDLMEHHLAHPDQMPAAFREHQAPPVVQVADYVAGMTDRFALGEHERIFGPDAAAAAALRGSS